MDDPLITPSRPGPKPTLTRSQLLDAALQLIDQDGLAGLNLRKLAGRLGVSAMTPYGYFADKNELLNEALGYALKAVQVDATSGSPWADQLEDAMRGMHDALERHPGVIDLIMTEDASGAGSLEAFRRDLIAMLADHGMSREQAITSLRTLTSYVLGYTMLTRLRHRSGPRRPASPATFDHGLRQLINAITAEADET